MRHGQSKHKVARYNCAQCDYKTANRYHLKVHVESKHEGMSYGCNLCEYNVPYKTSLVRHIKHNHATQLKQSKQEMQ